MQLPLLYVGLGFISTFTTLAESIWFLSSGYSLFISNLVLKSIDVVWILRPIVARYIDLHPHRKQYLLVFSSCTGACIWFLIALHSDIQTSWVALVGFILNETSPMLLTTIVETMLAIEVKSAPSDLVQVCLYSRTIGQIIAALLGTTLFYFDCPLYTFFYTQAIAYLLLAIHSLRRFPNYSPLQETRNVLVYDLTLFNVGYTIVPDANVCLLYYYIHNIPLSIPKLSLLDAGRGLGSLIAIILFTQNKHRLCKRVSHAFAISQLLGVFTVCRLWPGMDYTFAQMAVILQSFSRVHFDANFLTMMIEASQPGKEAQMLSDTSLVLSLTSCISYAAGIALTYVLEIRIRISAIWTCL